MFLKNRELRIRVAKTNTPDEETTETITSPFVNPEAIQAMSKEILKQTAIVIGCVLVVGTVLHTLSEIIIKNSTDCDE